MSKTLTVRFSDALIERNLSNAKIRQLKDERYHSLRLRFHANRTTASWYVIKYANGLTKWRKLGNWPELTTKALIAKLPAIQAELAVNSDSNQLIEPFSNVGELLDWYLDRALADSYLTNNRKSGLSSMICGHLKPRLGSYSIDEITRPVLDKALFRPLQKIYSVSYINGIWTVLKQVMNQAIEVHLIHKNPIAGDLFSNFIKTKIKEKPSAIRRDEVAALLSSFKQHSLDELMLPLMMLLHGTRIGETRQARWQHISFNEKCWTIPEPNTKTKKGNHILPLTPMAIDLLMQYKTQQQAKGYDGVYLFPNTKKRKTINGNKANDLIKLISGGLWHSHDLRKVASTTLTDLGTDYIVRRFILNHALNKLDKTYIHTYAETQKIKALVGYHTWLTRQGLFFWLKNYTETDPRQQPAPISPIGDHAVA